MLKIKLIKLKMKSKKLLSVIRTPMRQKASEGSFSSSYRRI